MGDPVYALLEFGCPTPRDPRGYVAEFGLTLADEARLLDQMKRWADEAHFVPGVEHPPVWGPVHAWRALSELGSAKVVPLWLEMLDTLEGLDDQWYLEELPQVCLRVGPSALSQLEAFLLDPRHGKYPRIAVAHGMSEIALSAPETADRVIATLSELLGRLDPEASDLNGFLVSYLLDLNACEHAGLIERAYAAGCVSAQVCGDWADVAFELGVGPRPPRRPNPFAGFLRDVEARSQSNSIAPPLERRPVKRGSSETKAKHKRQKQSRRKNRRR